MSTIDMTKVAGLQAVDTEGQVIGTLSVDDLTELVAANLVQSTKNEIVKSRSAALMSEASTLAATDEYEDQLPQDANPAFVCKKRSRLLQQKRRCCYSSDVAKLMFSS